MCRLVMVELVQPNYARVDVYYCRDVGYKLLARSPVGFRNGMGLDREGIGQI